jgi:hypothetical protein
MSTSASESLCRLYDWLKCIEIRASGGDPSLTELLVDGFDQEQIWQQIDVHNKFKQRALKKNIPVCSVKESVP